MRIPLFLSSLLLLLCLAAPAAASELPVWELDAPMAHPAVPEEPALGTREAYRSGKAMVAVGSVVQSIGFGLALVDGITGGGTIFVRVPFAFASIPFAPLTVAGYERILSDGSPLSTTRATGRGLLIGSLYSGLQAGFCGLAMAVHVSGFEDPTSVFEGAMLVPHAIVSLSMLVPGLIMSTARQTIALRSAPVPRPLVVPTLVPGGGGLQLFGAFP